MMRDRVSWLRSPTRTTNGGVPSSTAVTSPATISAPNRSACARISAMSSGPRMPSRNPGKFSTAVVSINCPPDSIPSMTSGFRFARAAYRAAVSPAGPDPMMITLRIRSHPPRGARGGSPPPHRTAGGHQSAGASSARPRLASQSASRRVSWNRPAFERAPSTTTDTARSPTRISAARQ